MKLAQTKIRQIWFRLREESGWVHSWNLMLEHDDSERNMVSTNSHLLLASFRPLIHPIAHLSRQRQMQCKSDRKHPTIFCSRFFHCDGGGIPEAKPVLISGRRINSLCRHDEINASVDERLETLGRCVHDRLFMHVEAGVN
jgi:hypothetical protein